MNIEQVKAFCRTYPGAIERESGHPSNLLAYSIGEKKFAYFKTSAPEKWRFSFRVIPERFLELSDQPGVKPARFMHRFHWVSVVNVELFDEGYLKHLIDWSYSRAVKSLPKKIQAQIGNP